MTREEAKELLPIIKAFAEGKVIECRTKPSALSKSWQDMNGWTEIKEIEFWNNTEYRIKPEPKYRPFANAEECWQEMLKHQPFGWLRNIFTQRLFNIDTISYTTYNIRINNSILDGDDAFNSYTFVDGTPFGIKEEENE